MARGPGGAVGRIPSPSEGRRLEAPPPEPAPAPEPAAASNSSSSPAASPARVSSRGPSASLPNLSKVSARKMVLVSSLALVVISIYKHRNGADTQTSLYQRLWGVGVVSFLLALLADFAPQIAGPFALLTVLGSLTHGGDQVISAALGKVGTSTDAGAPAGPTGPTGTPSTTPAPATTPNKAPAGPTGPTG